MQIYRFFRWKQTREAFSSIKKSSRMLPFLPMMVGKACLRHDSDSKKNLPQEPYRWWLSNVSGHSRLLLHEGYTPHLWVFYRKKGIVVPRKGTKHIHENIFLLSLHHHRPHGMFRKEDDRKPKKHRRADGQISWYYMIDGIREVVPKPVHRIPESSHTGRWMREEKHLPTVII